MKTSSRACLLAVLVPLVVAGSHGDLAAGDDSRSGSDYYAGLNCASLWHERNAIHARYGYCFQSNRAVATFGRGCFPPYGNLPSNLKRVVNHIKSIEQRRGC